MNTELPCNIDNLSPERQAVIRYMTAISDKAIKTGSGPNAKWEWQFDDGVGKGYYHFTAKQKELNFWECFTFLKTMSGWNFGEIKLIEQYAMKITKQRYAHKMKATS